MIIKYTKTETTVIETHKSSEKRFKFIKVKRDV